jgi:hypothetical protein
VRLSADEIRLIAVIILILTVGTAVKHYRANHPVPPLPPPATPAPFEPAGY